MLIKVVSCIKRPLIFIGACFICSLYLASFFSYIFSLIIACAMVIFIVFFFFIKAIKGRRILILTCFSILLSMVSFSLFTILDYNKIIAFEGQKIEIFGVITDKQKEKNSTYTYEAITKVGGNKAKIIIISKNSIDADYYDGFTTTVKLVTSEYDSGFSFFSSNKGKRIYLKGIVTGETLVTPMLKKPINFYLIKTKENCINSVRYLIPGDEGAVISALALGDTSYISETASNNIRITGLSHLLSLSGLHVSIISSFIFMLLMFLRVKKRLATFITIIFLIFYMAFVGLPFSVVRAGIMLVIFFIAKAFFVDSDSLNSLFVSILVMLLFNPFAVKDVSLMLSFSATLGIILIEPKIYDVIISKISLNEIIYKIIRYPAKLLSVTLSAIIFSLPIIILVFRSVSLVSPISNLLVLPFASFLIVFSFLTAFTRIAIFLYPLSYIFGFISGLLAKLLLFLIKLLASIPFASISLYYSFIPVFMVFWLSIFIIIIILKKYKLIKLVNISCVICFSFSIFIYFLWEKDTTQITIFPTQLSPSVLITKGKSATLLGCGDKYTPNSTLNILQKKNIKTIDLLVYPELTNTSQIGYNRLLEKTAIKNKLMPYNILDLEYYKKLYSFEFNDNSEFFILFNEKRPIILLSTDNINFVIVKNKKDFDYLIGQNTINKKFKQPNYLIITELIKGEEENLKVNNIIITSETVDISAFKNNNIYITSYDSIITLIIKNKKVSVAKGFY